MNRGQIEASKQLAQQFIEAADTALERLDTELAEKGNRYDYTTKEYVREDRDPSPHDYSYGSPETGALKRKSMDLTRSLAVLRK